MREVPSRPADLPDALVRLFPGVLEVAQRVAAATPRPPSRPRAGGRVPDGARRAPRRRRRAETDRSQHCRCARDVIPRSRGASRASAPAAAARPPTPYMICSADGSPAAARNSHLPPGARLFEVAGVDEGEQRERRVAEPAEAVVPVALAADLLRQRGRCCRDDPARRRVRQRLQDDERVVDLLAPPPFVGAPVGPVVPVVRRLAATRARCRCVAADARSTGTTSERSGIRSPSRTVNVADRAHVLATVFDRRAEAERVRPGRRRCGRPRSAVPTALSCRSRSG